MFKRQAKSSTPASKHANNSIIENKSSNKSRGHSEAPKKIERKRRSTLGSRVSVHSLLFPAAYSTVSKDVKQPMSRSVNDLQHTTASSDQSGDSSSERESIINGTPAPKTKLKECPLCFIRQPTSSFPQLTCCTHQSCQSCLVQYLQMEILESRVHVSCPECSEMLHPNDIYRLLCDHQHLVEKYEEFSVRRVLMTDPDTRWCPAPDCSYAVIATGCAACPELKCDRPGCNTLFCYHCKMTWHPSQTCNEARAQRGSFAASPIHIDTTIRPGDIKACPRCQTYIVKMNDGSCNHMICALCGAEFCWLCLKEISDLHYLSPSGCTFWGKKPWSRKKKLLWQLGMLVGAPVGIALVAGLAVPAIMFGVPVWIGRKVHQKLKDSTKVKRRLAVTASVFGSILMGPVLATMAVGVGVPIMLAYVYGVVPLSLCRNGSCGVTASPSGVRLDLDAEILAMSGDSAPLHEKTQLLSSVDKTDNSTVASLRSGSTTTQHKMQVHAEVLYIKRRPSIESGATSLGERVNYEDASVKALAGSTYYDDKSVHTMGSLAEGGSYCEDQASTKALAGSVICPIAHNLNNNNADTKSLCGAKSVCSGITTGGIMIGDNASVRGLAGSICSGVVEPSTHFVGSSAAHCSRCHKPLHHVTLHVVDLTTNHEECSSSSAMAADDWRKLSSESRQSGGGGNIGALENRITKFADQLSVESYDIGGATSANASANFVDDDESADSNMLLGADRRSMSRSIDKISLTGKKSLEPPLASGSRHLTAINEIYHACRRSLIQAVDDEPRFEQQKQHAECVCDDGEILLLPNFGSATSQNAVGGVASSKMSWKFLKKSRSWSAKLDASRAQVADQSTSSSTMTTATTTDIPSAHSSLSFAAEQQPIVHYYKKHPSSWKFRIARRSGGVPLPSTSLRSESKSTKLSNSYTSLPDINQQRRLTGESVKRDRKGQLAATLTNFFKANNN